MTDLFSIFVRWFSALYPWEVETSDELAESLSFINADYEPQDVVRAGLGAGIVTFLLSSVMLFTTLPLFGSVGLMIIFSLAVVHFVHTTPNVLAAFGRTEALGQSPNLIGRIVLRMQIQPATETAVQFAAETGNGRLSENLSYHIDRAMGTHRTGLTGFADEWGDEFPAVRRSAHLLVTAQDAPDAQRSQTLDRALTAMLDGTRDQMSRFTESIRAPSMMLYAFGVMVPLALVGLVPAASLADITITVDAFVILYIFVLPAALTSVSVWILIRRPVAFPPPDISWDHPDVPDRKWPPFVVGLAAGGVGYAGTVALGVGFLAPISAVGIGLGMSLYLLYRPIEAVRRHTRAVEEHLVDALYIIGRQVTENEAVESAITLTGKRVPGETGEVFKRAAEVQHQLHITVEDAFLGEYGALNNIPSPRAHGTASLLSIAADEGQPAGHAIVEMANHLDDLKDVERQTRRELSQVTGTLQNTATVFAPLVAGATIGLAEIMSSEGVALIDMGDLPTEALGLIIGVYILILSILLTALSIGLQHGLDRSLVGYRVGKTLLVSVPIYVISVFSIGLII